MYTDNYEVSSTCLNNLLIDVFENTHLIIYFILYNLPLCFGNW